jgi:hypothetical protein
MAGMVAAIPDIFWIFAGISLIIMASGYCKNMAGQGGSSKTQEDIERRLDRIEQHLDIRD